MDGGVVRFRWERWGRDFRRLMLFLEILCPVTGEGMVSRSGLVPVKSYRVSP